MGSNQNSPQFHHPSRNTKTSPKICHNFSRKTVGTSTHYATIYMSHRCKRVRGNGMNTNGYFDAYKFYETYAAIPEEGYVAWFSYLDASGVWCPDCVGPITVEGAIQLLRLNDAGNISNLEIRCW